MKKQFLDLTDEDIKNNKFIYDSDQIEYSIINNNLSLRNLVKYQKLSAYICAKYVIFGGINETYGDCVEDRWLDDIDILKKQPHITRNELLLAHKIVFEEMLIF